MQQQQQQQYYQQQYYQQQYYQQQQLLQQQNMMMMVPYGQQPQNPSPQPIAPNVANPFGDPFSGLTGLPQSAHVTQRNSNLLWALYCFLIILYDSPHLGIEDMGQWEVSEVGFFV